MSFLTIRLSDVTRAAAEQDAANLREIRKLARFAFGEDVTIELFGDEVLFTVGEYTGASPLDPAQAARVLALLLERFGPGHERVTLSSKSPT